MSDRSSSSKPSPEVTSDPNLYPQQNSNDDRDTQVKAKQEGSPSLPSPTTIQKQQSPLPSPSSPTSPRQLKAAQRRAILLEDPQCGGLEPHRIYCHGCKRWIKLNSHSEYGVNNWNLHKQRCSPVSPSRHSLRRRPSKPKFGPTSQHATIERKVLLHNDPQVKSFSATYVCCGACETEVALQSEINYDLTKWTEHKEKCIPVTPAPITLPGSSSHTNPPRSASGTWSRLSAEQGERSVTPVGENNSTEATAVAEGSQSPGGVKVGVKRGREEDMDEEEKEKDMRPTNRPRTDMYKQPEKNPASLFGWLTQPLKEFARGFREGLSAT